MISSFAATIGFFDGVHLGHQFLIDCLKHEAQQRGLRSMVVTFGEHPRKVLCPDWHPQLLSTPEEKVALLRAAGVDEVVVLPFSVEMARLSARAFMQHVLKEQLGVTLLLTGYDNRFGHNREEGFDDYVAYGREMGMEVLAAKPLRQGDGCYSSSMVRRLLTEGDVAGARQCLGRPYSLSGHVGHGEQIGRQLGFPTANIVLDNQEKLIPCKGVYAVGIKSVNLMPLLGKNLLLGGMMNIGQRPTFGGHRTTLEVHILGYRGDLYGKSIDIEFVERLRDEQHFESAEALVKQMEEDARRTRIILDHELHELRE